MHNEDKSFSVHRSPHPVQSMPPSITIPLLQRSRLSALNCSSNIIQVSSPQPSIGQSFHISRTIASKLNPTSEKGRLGNENFVYTRRRPAIDGGCRTRRYAYTSPRRLFVYIQYCFRISEAAAITMPVIAKAGQGPSCLGSSLSSGSEVSLSLLFSLQTVQFISSSSFPSFRASSAPTS